MHTLAFICLLLLPFSHEVYRINEFIGYLDYLVEVNLILPNDTCEILHADSRSQFYKHSTKSIEMKNNNLETNLNFSSINHSDILPHFTKRKRAITRMFETRKEIMDVWFKIEPLLCGNIFLNLKGPKKLTNRQNQSFSQLLYIFTSNPKVLYAPNTTHVNRVIEKANISFAVMDNITKNGELWQETAMNIRQSLKDPVVIFSLNFLNDIKQAYQRNSELFNNLTIGQPIVQEFLDSNNSLPNLNLLDEKLKIVENIVCAWKLLLSNISINWFKGFETEQQAVEYATSHAYFDGVSVFATLIFEVDGDGRLPPHVKYKIRQNASLTQDTKTLHIPFWRRDTFGFNFLYYTFGFVWIQDIIERSLIWEYVGHEVVDPGVYVHRMPSPCFIFDAFTTNLEHIMPVAMILSWVYSVAMFVQHIVYEKEERLKEVMKMMGLSNGVHWLAWFISIFFQLEITVTAICVLLKYGSFGILPRSNFAIIWIFFTAFATATISFCFFISVLFSKAKVASACSGIMYFLTYLPYAYLSIQENVLQQPVNFYAKSAASLVSTSAFGFGTKYLAIYELNGNGVQWNNIARTPVEGDTFSLLQAIIMLFIDAFVYSIFTWYIEAVFPGQYGLPKPWYFPVTLSYWMGPVNKNTKSIFSSFNFDKGYSVLAKENKTVLSASNTPTWIEPEPLHLTLGIKIENLTKIYNSNGKKAVDNLTLNFYQNQITCFLGHNGAGKTTTMSLLTGLIPPTSGTAYIYGHDIRKEIFEIRKNLGMCPQHNALFNDLTVKEHLWFYGRLKGIPSQLISSSMENFLYDIGLNFKRNSKVKSLSGGMKRKLSVAIAFVGGSKTVILDEPTAGVDPYARRAIWDLIVKYKQDRTILLSTHHMDEADLLGDRIAIVSNGQLQCCGSSLFLKSMYGEGYHLTLLKKVSGNSVEETTQTNLHDFSNSNESEITSFVQSHIKSAMLKRNSAHQISFNLPFEAAQKGWFYKLFNTLPHFMGKLKITGYGLRDTTLEEVFLKVEALKSKESKECNKFVQENNSKLSYIESPLLNKHKKKSTLPSVLMKQLSDNEIFPQNLYDFAGVEQAMDFDTVIEGININESSLINTTPTIKHKSKEITANWKSNFTPIQKKQKSKPHCFSKIIHHMRILQGLLAKRFHYARRSRKAVFYQIMLPAFFICIAMSIALSLPSSNNSLPLVLSLSQFHNLTQPRGNFLPYSDQSAVFPVRRRYPEVDANASHIISTFFQLSGLGTACVLKKNSTFFLEPDAIYSYNKSFLKEFIFKHFSPECFILTSFSHAMLPFSNDQLNHSSHSNVKIIRRKDIPCGCKKEGNGYVCSKSFGNFPVIHTVLSREHLINITGKVPIRPYLLYTTNNYLHHRYGAFALNEIRENFKERPPTLPSRLRKLSVREASQVFFNPRGFHALPTYLNVFNNALLRANLPASKGDPAKFGITVVNHPMNKTVANLSLDFLISGTDVIIAVFIIVAMSFVPASFLVFLVSEKQSKAKHLQFISGADPLMYWLSNYMWDLVNYLFPAAVCILILILFGFPAYTRGNNMYAVVALFLLYGWSMTPMMYPVSFYFTVPSSAYVCMIVINLFVGITTVITTFMISLFNTNPTLKSLNEKLELAFHIFPNYNLGKGLMDLSFYEFLNQFHRSTGQFHKIRDPFEWDIILRSIISMVIFGVIGFVITLLFEVRFFTRIGKGKNKKLSLSSPSKFEDIDVAKERSRVDRISNLDYEEHLIVVNNICKVFHRSGIETIAVNGLSFAVRRGECFGLLGVNGAGKTTTFQLITGALNVSRGNIRIAGHLMTGGKAHERLLAQQSTGYCPQFDALFDELTPIEHLRLYAKLRGVSRKDENRVVTWAIDKLDLTRHCDKPALHLSGGNRRKLSVAIALVGDPPVILLDEPTAGMDPGARRFLWNLVRDLTRSGRAVLLTSHSMEECEVLCSRIAIMVNGKFKCLGPTQHLKNRFGNGYMVSVRSTEPNLFVHAFKIAFPFAILKEQHYHKAVFQLVFSENGNSPMTLASVFQMIEERKGELMIEDYSVSQTTLDDVFINFAQKQGSKDAGRPYIDLLTRVLALPGSALRWFFERLFGVSSAPSPMRLEEDASSDERQM